MFLVEEERNPKPEIAPPVIFKSSEIRRRIPGLGPEVAGPPVCQKPPALRVVISSSYTPNYTVALRV